MKKLYIGQRVRVVGPAECRWLGCEATIVGRRESTTLVNRDGFTREVGLVWDLDVQGWGRFAPCERHICALPENLEPIVPDGHKPCEEEFKELLDNLLLKETADVT